jgi:hypothetical protein
MLGTMADRREFYADEGSQEIAGDRFSFLIPRQAAHPDHVRFWPVQFGSGSQCPLLRLSGNSRRRAKLTRLTKASRQQRNAKWMNKHRLFYRNYFSFWLLSHRSAKSRWIEDEKVSSSKWSNHC